MAGLRNSLTLISNSLVLKDNLIDYSGKTTLHLLQSLGIVMTLKSSQMSF